ncbi:uncharacterized protein N7483_001209 [Penicillium malachiteum]|uniref:uncharacterized protein n=1 Tax=Penicillium malachiteum TaxID=1324776 RepID=UPI002548EC95|nr:uncharacterized protein N7483_001209 [Penicillium malachiteum]KAJ5736084.1 hypothetical protein N7483_001209 [Penicillium malachiteum]
MMYIPVRKHHLQSPPQKQQDDQPIPSTRNDDDDEDSDLDDLDDVLDDFSKPKPTAQPAAPVPTQDPSTEDFDEDAFLKQLEQDMANMIGNPGGFPVRAKWDPPPGDFLKQLLADVMAEEGGDPAAAAAALGGKASSSTAAPVPAPATSTGASASDEQTNESFSDAIQRTMERMKESGDRATEAATEDDGVSDDMLAQLLKAMEAGAAGAGDEGDLTKMFMGMMEQLSNKEMLYEPMKELDGKFEPWIEKNKAEGKVPKDDMQRYEAQAKVVKQIVQKFEKSTYSDDDPKCREYVWERMQEMQAAGSPPEELVSNPLMEETLGAAAAGGPGGPGGVPDCPQQ